MREIITSDDVQRHISTSDSDFEVSPEAVITDVAKEEAERLGVVIVRAEEPRSRDDEQEMFSAVRIIDLARGGSEAPLAAPAVRRSSPFSDDEHRRWRSEFPGLENSVHLANCSQGAQSYEVSQAIDEYMQNWLSEGMDWNYWVEKVSEAKAEFARFVGADDDDVAVVGSVSEAISSVASGIDYEADRHKILLTEAEFPTVGHVWLAHRKYGAEVDFVPLRDGEIHLEDYDRLADESTFMVSATHVYYQNGYKQDLKAVADVVHSNGAYLLVDGYQSCGAVDIDVKEQDIDVFTTGNLKYLLGVPGIAFVYVKPELVSELRPAETGWFAQQNPFAFDVKSLDYADTARRLEGGTPPVTAAFAATAGMRLLREVGMQRIEQHIDFLSEYAIRGAEDRGLQVASPGDIAKKGPTTAIEIPGDSQEVEYALKRQNIVTSARGNVIRVAPHFFNTPAEIDVALDALARILERR